MKTIHCQYSCDDQRDVQLGRPTLDFSDGWVVVPKDLHASFLSARVTYQAVLDEVEELINGVERASRHEEELDARIERMTDEPFLLERGTALWERLAVGPKVTVVRCRKRKPVPGLEDSRWTLENIKVLEREGE